MSFLPEDELQSKRSVNLAPMIDFLFLMLVFFASLAVSRIATKDAEIELVKIEEEQNSSVVKHANQHIIQIAIGVDGSYRWETDLKDYKMETAKAIAEELLHQHSKGLIPKEKGNTKVLLKIDKQAPWEPIMQAIFAIRQSGFYAFPLYEPESSSSSTVIGTAKS